MVNGMETTQAKYKLSKYNFHTWNDNEELLLFNSYSGADSFLKVEKNDSKLFESYFDNENDINSLPENVLAKLDSKGFIVPETEDEKQKLKLIYLSELNNSVLNLIILPTGQCNFRCKYCYESFEDGAMSRETQDMLVKYVSKNIYKFSGLSVSWFGGEPLVGMEAVEYLSEKFMQICKKHGKAYTANATTNGYLLDYEMEKRLRKLNLTSYQITIDGLAKTHNFQKPLVGGGETFDRVISNLMDIKENEKSKVLNISIRTNVSKEVLEDMDAYIEFFSSRFGDDKRFKFFLRPVMDLGGERVGDFKENMIEENALEKAYHLIGEKANGKMPMIYDSFLGAKGGVCYAGELNSFVIDPKGKVLKCTCNLDNCPENEIGHLDEKGSLNLNDEKYAAWLCSGKCDDEDCFFAPNCLRESCPATRVVHKIIKNSCPHEKVNLPYVLKLLDSQNNSFEVLEAIKL